MSHPTQIEDPEPDQPLKDLIFYVGRVGIPLREKNKTYLDSDDLARLKVQCTEIDFDSGTPKDEGFKVLKPKSFNEMSDIAQAKKLFDESAIPVFGDTTNWHTANYLAQLYMGVLDTTPQEDRSTVNDPDPSNQSLLQLSPWEVLEGVRCQNMHPEIHWQVSFSLQRSGNSGPDIMCFLANEHPLKDDQLLLSEFSCIMRMSMLRLHKGRSHNYRIVPVTVVSVSDKYVRIVQGYGDSSKGCIVVRKSRIISLEENGKLNSEGFIRIACWLLGDPCEQNLGHRR
ncbi:hypothetical protein F5X96DRAFT_643586 [Biscogniauxia mediterranea]|nr:hypothetical protein F5X96DRAFT_643586 [Biscogniauxia mediterranea]